MKIRNPMLGALAAPVVAIFLAACAAGNDLPELEPDQSLVRVENDIADAQHIEVYLEDVTGTTVTLGMVRRGDAENFVLRTPDFEDDMRLVAVTPGDKDMESRVVSRTFVAQGGMTVNWFLPENELEVME